MIETILEQNDLVCSAMTDLEVCNGSPDGFNHLDHGKLGCPLKREGSLKWSSGKFWIKTILLDNYSTCCYIPVIAWLLVEELAPQEVLVLGAARLDPNPSSGADRIRVRHDGPNRHHRTKGGRLWTLRIEAIRHAEHGVTERLRERCRLRPASATRRHLETHSRV